MISGANLFNIILRFTVSRKAIALRIGRSLQLSAKRPVGRP
jgi:hypothetical protein